MSSGREQRAGAAVSLRGLLTAAVRRKNVEAMARRLLGSGPDLHQAQRQVRALQQFIGAGAWDDDALLAEHQRLVAESLGEADGVLILDGSDVPKRGTHSAGGRRSGGAPQWRAPQWGARRARPRTARRACVWAPPVGAARPCSTAASSCPRGGSMRSTPPAGRRLASPQTRHSRPKRSWARTCKPVARCRPAGWCVTSGDEW